MRLIYESFDGEQFETKEDCFNHEAKIIAREYGNDIVGLDVYNRKVSLAEGLEKFFQKSYFLLFRADKAIDFIKDQNLDQYFELPPLQKGAFFYNSEAGEWLDMDWKIGEIRQAMEGLEEIKNKLYSSEQSDD